MVGLFTRPLAEAPLRVLHGRAISNPEARGTLGGRDERSQGELMTVALLLVLAQDIGKLKEELRKGLAAPDETVAMAAIDGLAASNTPAAVDVLLAAIGAIFKDEWDGMDRRKSLESAERRAREEHQKYMEKYRKASQEYNSTKTQEANDKLKKASEEMRPYSKKYSEARAALQEFITRYKSLALIRDHAQAALLKFNSDPAVNGFIDRFKGSPDWIIRAGLADVLERIDRPQVVQALLHQLKREKEATVKVAILDALASKPTAPEIVQAAIEHLKSDAWQVTAAALELIRKAGAKEAVDAVIEAMTKADGRLIYDFEDTLAALTGVDKGILPNSWKAWWEQNKDEVLAGSYKPRQEEKAGAGEGFTRFFGIPVNSKRAVFVLDRSGSMSSPADFDIPIDTGDSQLPADLQAPKGKRKIDVARWQLKKALWMMPDGALFNVIFYGSAFDVYKEHMIKLDKRTREEAFAYIDTMEPTGATNIFDSLERALQFAMGDDGRLKKDGVDTIYLLSDGMPNQGKFRTPEEIQREVARINDSLKVVINTILVGASGAAGSAVKRPDEEFMKKLAEDNNGKFSAVRRKISAAPPK